jgi:hypothetical protein
MQCPYCSANTPHQANFCPTCGRPVSNQQFSGEPPTRQARPRLDIFLLSILGSIALTLILTTVFHLPIFFLGAFLPFIGFGLRGRRS